MSIQSFTTRVHGLYLVHTTLFVRNVATLASGTLAGQAIMVAILPALTRLYDPHSLGLLGIYMSAVMLVSIPACLRLELAIPLPEYDEDAINLLVLALLAATAVGVATGLLVLFAPGVILRLLDQPDSQRQHP